MKNNTFLSNYIDLEFIHSVLEGCLTKTADKEAIEEAIGCVEDLRAPYLKELQEEAELLDSLANPAPSKSI